MFSLRGINMPPKTAKQPQLFEMPSLKINLTDPADVTRLIERVNATSLDLKEITRGIDRGIEGSQAEQ
jgi:hypothetical protein